MTIEHITGGRCSHPFPVYEDLAGVLASAHPAGRDPVVAHVLGTCAGYAYADADTFGTMMTRIGLEQHASLRLTQIVDAMFIFSTAYLVQSRCGRVVILCYRGTEPAAVASWVGDAEVGSESSRLVLEGNEAVRVHSGFHRNVRASWLSVVEQLRRALDGRSLTRPGESVEHPMEALYVAGHSLGGAMALLFALALTGSGDHRAIADTLRAVYTFGQPMAVCTPLPAAAELLGRRLFRHVIPRDLIPALPPVAWGPFTHIGHEYRYTGGTWQRSETPVAQVATMREIPRSVIAFFATEKQRSRFRYTLATHAPHHYLDALRPPGRVTEWGDAS